jgi:hypothetical protein
MSLDDALRRYAYQLTLALKQRHFAFQVKDYHNDNTLPRGAA